MLVQLTVQYYSPPPTTTISGLYSQYTVQSPVLPPPPPPPPPPNHLPPSSPLMSVDNSDQQKLSLITSPGQDRISPAHPALPPPSYTLLQSN